MKLQLSTGINCPECGVEATIESTLLQTFFFGSLLDTLKQRIERAGATLTCEHCHQRNWIAPKIA